MKLLDLYTAQTEMRIASQTLPGWWKQAFTLFHEGSGIQIWEIAAGWELHYLGHSGELGWESFSAFELKTGSFKVEIHQLRTTNLEFVY